MFHLVHQLISNCVYTLFGAKWVYLSVVVQKTAACYLEKQGWRSETEPEWQSGGLLCSTKVFQS